MATLHRAPVLDAPAIAAHEAGAAHHPWSEGMVRSALLNPGAVGWVAHENDDLVGHVLSRVVLDEAELWTIAVSPTHRRTGLATALHTAVVDDWRARAVTHAHLEVRDDNEGARALYRRLGWTHAGVRRRYYADDCDALLLTLAL